VGSLTEWISTDAEAFRELALLMLGASHNFCANNYLAEGAAAKADKQSQVRARLGVFGREIPAQRKA